MMLNIYCGIIPAQRQSGLRSFIRGVNRFIEIDGHFGFRVQPTVVFDMNTCRILPLKPTPNSHEKLISKKVLSRESRSHQSPVHHAHPHRKLLDTTASLVKKSENRENVAGSSSCKHNCPKTDCLCLFLR